MTDIVEAKSPTLSIIQSALPRFDDDWDNSKALYLSYRISNFTIKEACVLAKVEVDLVMKWRAEDENFAHLDGAGLTELRKEMANEFVGMQFIRNFRMVMDRDYQILYKAATDGEKSLLPSEIKYLEKIRKQYTPQSLALINQFMANGVDNTPLDFTKMVMEINQSKITMTKEY